MGPKILRHPGHKILRTCCRESARKRLKQPGTYPITTGIRQPAEALTEPIDEPELVASAMLS